LISDARPDLKDLTSKKLIGQVYYEFFPEILGSQTWDVFQQVMKDRISREFETFSVVVNLWLRAIVYPQASGGIAVFYRDITDEKVSEIKATEILENIQDAFFAGDAHWCFSYVNRHTEALFGKKRDELIGRNILEVFPEALDSETTRAIKTALKEGTSREFEAISAVLGHWIAGVVYPQLDGGFAVYFHDITERKKLEERFRIVVESSPNAIIMINASSQIVMVNAQTERFFGYTREELLGQSLEILIPARFRTEHFEKCIKYFKSPTVRSLGEGRDLFGIRKDGTEFPIEIGLTPIETEDGPMVISTMVDISLRKKVEAALLNTQNQLIQSNEELRASNKELENFTYIVSHDLREPIRGISNFAQFLKMSAESKLTEEELGRIATILRMAKRMDELTEALLEYSRVGRTEFVLETVDMNELIFQLIEQMGLNFTEHGISIKVLPCLPTVKTDRIRILEVITNLITNAIKYTDQLPGKRLIEIGCRCVSNQYEMYVRDNGIGIAPEHLEEVFQIFKRLHSRDEYGGGHGAGLTISRKTIERLGGRLWVESKGLGEGSIFWFTIGEILTKGNKQCIIT
jgi:PAS domain S-box-containing protein